MWVWLCSEENFFCCCSVAQLCPLFATPWTAACQAPLSSTISWSLLKFMSIELVIPCNHLILCYPLLLWPSTFPSISIFSNESLHEMAKVLELQLQHIPINIQSWFPLGLTGLITLQSKELSRVFSSIAVWKDHSAFFIVQLSHLYMTTGKTIASNIQTFVSNVKSLLFNTLSGFVTAFLPRNKHFLISWPLLISDTVLSDLGAQENKICHCFHFFTFCVPWSDGTRCHDLSFLNVEF